MSDDHFPAVDPRILRAAAEGCTESRILMNRRHMLGVSAGFFAWAFDHLKEVPDPIAQTIVEQNRQATAH